MNEQKIRKQAVILNEELQQAIKDEGRTEKPE
jgi:hypothetical protein